MKDYKAMTIDQRTAYNEGLLDAIDYLNRKALGEPGAILAAGLRVAAAELIVFRNEQLAPPDDDHGTVIAVERLRTAEQPCFLPGDAA